MLDDFDLERRFGGLRRLYGGFAYDRIRAARVGIVGLGGVGSWAAEALARSGVAAITLFDLDHVAESNINRQIQALSHTLGQSKVLAIQDRVMQIHPGCVVRPIEAFVDEASWPNMLPTPLDILIDACDQVRAKAVLCAWALSTQTPLVCAGAAGGKQFPHKIEVADLSEATHDPLLASLRQRLRQKYAAPPGGQLMGIRCVFSREPIKTPALACEWPLDGTLNCHGYGSSVMVTSTLGMVAASEAVQLIIRPHG